MSREKWSFCQSVEATSSSVNQKGLFIPLIMLLFPCLLAKNSSSKRVSVATKWRLPLAAFFL